MADLTLGEKRVRLSFNPNANMKVEAVKIAFAMKIDELEKMRETVPAEKSLEDAREIQRSISIAQSLCEDACEKYVKAVTAFF